jgi:hypothetical protein
VTSSDLAFWARVVAVNDNVNHDRSSRPSVATFKRSRAICELNSRNDRDGDGVACEKL